VTRCRECQPLPEDVARAAELLGRRWVLAILWASAEAGAVRFNEFKQTLETIPPRTLAARLVELEEAGILRRRVLHTRPPRVEYRLTALGLRLGALVEAMHVWASSA
jgi:DNA-binding HxlR family transcriptional regulator